MQSSQASPTGVTCWYGYSTLAEVFANIMIGAHANCDRVSIQRCGQETKGTWRCEEVSRFPELYVLPPAPYRLSLS